MPNRSADDSNANGRGRLAGLATLVALMSLAALTVLTPLALPPAAVAGPAQEEEEQLRRLVERAAPAVWMVEAVETLPDKRSTIKPVGNFRMVRLGTAFVWRAEEGLLLTSASVVGRADRVSLVQLRQRLEAEVVAVDVQTDIALLRLVLQEEKGDDSPSPKAHPVKKQTRRGTALTRELPLADSAAAKVGHRTWVLGPDTVPLRISEGRLNHTEFRLAALADPVMVLSNEVGVSAAGSPVLTTDGRVVGMVHSTGLGRPSVGRAWTAGETLHIDGRVTRTEPVEDPVKPSTKDPSTKDPRDPKDSQGGSPGSASSAATARSLRVVVPLEGGLLIQTDDQHPAPQMMIQLSNGTRLSVDRLLCVPPSKTGEPEKPSGTELPGQLAWTDLGFSPAPPMAMGLGQGPPTFAMSADLLAAVAEDLRQHKRVPRGQMGLAVRDSGQPAGAQIHWLVEGGPAAKSGLAVGDVIVSIAGKTVADASDYVRRLRSAREGQTLAVGVVGPDQRFRAVTVLLSSLTVQAFPANLGSPQQGPPKPDSPKPDSPKPDSPKPDSLKPDQKNFDP